MSRRGDHEHEAGGPGVELLEGQLSGDAGSSADGPASLYRLRPRIERFHAASGALHLIAPGPEPDLVVQRPTAEDRALLAALDGPAASIVALERELMAAGTPLSREAIISKLGDLRRAGALVSHPQPAEPLPGEDAIRFDRQLPYWEEHGEPVGIQRRLLEASVAILGCGGLGTWALAALATTGIRRFTLIDDDAVDLSNLNRQVLYATGDVGASKVERAAAWVRRFEPRASIKVIDRAAEGVADLEAALAGVDVLVHAADRPPYDIVRWADEACRRGRIPYIVAGQVPPVLKIGPTYVPGVSACFACQEASTRAAFPLYDELTASRLADPAPATTLGPASGVAGTLMAMEVMHLLTLDGPVATEGRALLLDMRTLETRWERIERRDDCPACNHLARDGRPTPRRPRRADLTGESAVASVAFAPADGIRGSSREPG